MSTIAYDELADQLFAALRDGDQTRLRGVIREELGEPLTGDLEQWVLMQAVGLPTHDTYADGVLDRIKARRGDDIGALLCVAMVQDLQLSTERAAQRRNDRSDANVINPQNCDGESKP